MWVLGIPSKELTLPSYLVKEIGNLKVVMSGYTNIDVARNILMYKAMKMGGNLLMLDLDVQPKMHIVDIMKVAEEWFKSGYDVVCGAYYLKNLIGISVGILSSNAEKLNMLGLMPSEMEITWLPRPTTKPIEVDVCGTGFIAVNYEFIRRTFDKDRPWFQTKIVDYDTGKVIGEDVNFFLTFRPKTIFDNRLVADHWLSNSLKLTPEGILSGPSLVTNNDAT